MIKVWCEWDIGLNDKVFIDKYVALKHAKLAWDSAGFDDDFTFDAAFEDHYIGFEDVEYVDE